MMISDPLKGVFDAFDPLGMLLRVSIQWGYFLGSLYVPCLLRAFLSFLDEFLLHFLHPGDFRGIFYFYFLFFAKIHIVYQEGLNYM